ncbi:MAG: di-heme oxidoredictase family protein [Anderseniella sp.]
MKTIVTAVIAATALGSAVHAQDMTGAQMFRQNWTSAETASDGLGPIFNEASCHACHWFGGGARIRVRPDGEVAGAGVLLRHTFVDGKGDPHYGVQLQNKAVDGVEAEGVADLSAVQVADGLTRFLASVRFASGPGRTAGITMSLRAAPALDSTALVAQVSDAAVIRGADSQDKNKDGISGRVHLLQVPGEKPKIGRFNWKATAAKVEDQIANALWFDMGLTSSAHRAPQGECTSRQLDCLKTAGSLSRDLAPDFDNKEIVSLADHVRSLVGNPKVPEQPRSFVDAGCNSCHTPHMETEDGGSVALFSNLLLHDMGDGLTSYGGEGSALPTEWRTTPLVGFRGQLPDHRYLHDGRAANIDEAIRWHGGEAQRSRDAYIALPASEKLKLTSFVLALMSSMPVPPKGD